MIEQNFLQNNSRLGKVLRLNSITKVTFREVCAFYLCQPYNAEGGSENLSINALLKATGYSPNESHRAIMVVEPEVVYVSNFKRSENLDILSSHDIKPEHKSRFAEGFKLANVLSIQNAAITNVESQGRIFLVMGG